MRKGIFILLLCPFVFSSCLKKEEPDVDKEYPEFIVFGNFQNPVNCGGAEFCVELYKMDITGLREDTQDNAPTESSSYNGSFTSELSDFAYNNVQELWRSNPLPDEIRNAPSGKIGTAPSWANNFYIEYKTAGFYGHWIIDGSFDGSLPPAVQQFLSTIQQSINFAAQG